MWLTIVAINIIRDQLVQTSDKWYREYTCVYQCIVGRVLTNISNNKVNSYIDIDISYGLNWCA